MNDKFSRDESVIYVNETVVVQGNGDDSTISYDQLRALLDRDERTGSLAQAEITGLEDGRIQIVRPGKHDPATEQPYDEVYHVSRTPDGGIFMTMTSSVDRTVNNEFENRYTSANVSFSPDGNARNVNITEVVKNGEGDVAYKKEESLSMDYTPGTDKMRSITSSTHEEKANSKADAEDGYTKDKTENVKFDGAAREEESLETTTQNDGTTIREQVDRDISSSGRAEENRTVTTTTPVMAEGENAPSEQVKVEQNHEIRNSEGGPVVYGRKDVSLGKDTTETRITELNGNTGLYDVREWTFNPNDRSRSYAVSNSKDGQYEGMVGERFNYDGAGHLVSTQTAGQDQFVGWDDPVYMPGFNPIEQRLLAMSPSDMEQYLTAMPKPPSY